MTGRQIQQRPSRNIGRRAAINAAGRVLTYRTARNVARYAFNKWKGQTTQKKNARKAKLDYKVAPNMTGSSFSKYTDIHKCPREIALMYKQVAENYYNVNAGFRVSGAINQQGWLNSHFFTQGDLSGIEANIPANSPSTATYKWVIKDCKADYMITNQEATNCFVDIYECAVRFDENIAGTSATGYNKNTGLGMIEAGVNHENTVNSVNISKFGVTPFDSDLFTQFVKVQKVIHVELGPGRSHRHMLYMKPNKMIHSERINNGFAYANLSRILIIRVWGCPLNDKTTVTNVGMSASNVDVVLNTRYSYYWEQDDSKTYYNTTGLGTITTASIMNEESGQQQTDVAA